MLVQFCFEHEGKQYKSYLSQHSAEENPVIEFDMPVILIWFLLRVLTDDGNLETEKGIGYGEEVS